MKVTFKQSGGLGGLSKSGVFDTESLPDVQARELTALIAGSSGLAPGARLPVSGGADREHYSIVIEGPDGSRSIEVDEGSVPEEIKPLVRFLRKQSQYQKSG